VKREFYAASQIFSENLRDSQTNKKCETCLQSDHIFGASVVGAVFRDTPLAISSSQYHTTQPICITVTSQQVR